MQAIQTDKLTKYYGKNRGIIELDLTVEEGDFFGFIGPNGAGKSTTIRTLLGLIHPTKGTAQILGRDILKQKMQNLSQIGYLPSEVAFYSGMKVKDVISFSANLHKKDCSFRAKELCERMELDTERKIDELSFGNKKKVGIVCAMQHDPQLYIMDEPTSGLDPLMQREFFSLLKERNQAGATIFLSSHVLSEVQKYCAHAAVIREGKLLACDSVENLGHTGAKRVVLRGVQNLPAVLTQESKKNISVRDISITEEGLQFLYSGNPRMLLYELSQLPLTDITITEPDLEEVFLHYYEKEEH